MLKLNSVMLGSADPQALADFYQKVLEQEPNFQDGEWFGFDTGGCSLTIAPHDKVSGHALQPERIILNIETTEVKSEFARIKALNVEVIGEPYGMDSSEAVSGLIATFADREGIYFQLMTPWEG